MWVGVVEGRGVERIEALALTDGSILPAGLVVIGVGTSPSTGWLDGSDVPVNDGVVCGSDLRVRGLPAVWAVGDACRWFNPRYGREMRIEHWTSAREQASQVAAAIAGDRPGECDLVPYVWADQHGVHIQHVGETVRPEDTVVTRMEGGGGFMLEYQRGGQLVGATGFDSQRTILTLRRQLGAAEFLPA